MMSRIYYATILLVFSLIVTSCRSGEESKDHEDSEHHNHSDIVMHSEQAIRFGVEYETVSPGNFSDVIKTSGVIEPSISDVFTVTAKKNGIVSLVPGLSIGSQVKVGEKLGSVSSEGVQGGDLAEAAKANLEASKAEYERLKPLYEDGLITASAFREAERSYKEAQALAGKNGGGGSALIISPGEGIIQKLFVNTGEYVETGSPVATVSKNTNLMLRADLPAREVSHYGEIMTANFIPEGSEIAVSLSDANGKKLSEGTPAALNNGYIPVYFSFSGSPLSFPGGYAEVFLICGERKGVISVPRGALVEIQGNKYVYVRIDDEEYEKRLVVTGSSDGNRIEVKEGLSEGDIIVSKGASILRMAEVSTMAPPSHTHNH